MRRIVKFASMFVLVLALGGAAGCKQHAAGGKTLYERLGGGTALTAVVDDFLANVQADTRINHFFLDADMGKIKTGLVNLIGQATGGPENYTGRDMKTTHAGLGISEADFNALLEDLSRSLDKFRVGDKEKGELLGLLGAMKGDIVEK